jgi:hypothetical protein
MTEPGSFTDEQLDAFSNSPKKIMTTYKNNNPPANYGNTTNDIILRTITPTINSRTLVMHQEYAPGFKIKRDIIEKKIQEGEILNEEAIQRLEEYDKDMFALYTRMHPGGGRRTRGARNKKRSRSRSRRHKKRSSKRRKRSRS